MAKLTKREKEKLAKTATKHWKVVLALVLVAVVSLVVAYYLGWLNKLLGKDKEPMLRVQKVVESSALFSSMTTLEVTIKFCSLSTACLNQL